MTSGAEAPAKTTAGDRRENKAVARKQSGSLKPAVQPAFAQRSAGATVGTTSNGVQAVFAESTAAKGNSAKAAPARSERAAAPTTRSAAGDLWTGFEPAERSSVFAAEATAAGQTGDVGGTAALALAGLGLGLIGLAGAASVAVVRSRSKARAKVGGSTK